MTKLSKNAIRKYLRYGIKPADFTGFDRYFLETLKSEKLATVGLLDLFKYDIKPFANYVDGRWTVTIGGYTIKTRKCNGGSLLFYR